MKDNIIIGVTGSFGSGCTTLTEVLRDDFGYRRYSLSDRVKEKWSNLNKESTNTDSEPQRSQLQDYGNQLRRENRDFSVLAGKTLEKVVNDGTENNNLVFDSIRNPAEIEFLRNKFPSFFLIAVHASEYDRWERVREKDYERFNLSYDDFKKDDDRDKNEDGDPSGQQVALCVDEADVLIRNDTSRMRTNENAIKRALKEKLGGILSLFEGESRPPEKMESFMNLAYSSSLMSQCVKRQVGAVILDERSRVVGVGYNENPTPLKPCYLQFGDCYRDIYIENEIGNFERCPDCGELLVELRFPYKCGNCGVNIYKKYIRDRALGKCTALHAEEKALMNAGSVDLRGCTLYVTTFPCFKCAQKILDAGIRAVCYVESYPDLDSIGLLESATSAEGIRLVNMWKFEGVKARAFFRLFGPWRRKTEKELTERKYK